MTHRKQRAAMVRIGTSGWHYAHWKGPFYPATMPSSQFLAFYTERYTTVELNNPFYRIPSEKTFAAWRERTPPGFLFAVKANRRFTHVKKLKDPQPDLDLFMQAVDALGDKLGPVLFQLPPRWRLNLERLAEFLTALPKRHRYTIEFRDPSWHTAEVYALLRRYDVAFCIYELNHFLSPLEVTADFAYIRLHGPDGPYQGRYDDANLSEWARRIALWQREGIDTYCYFDNDQAAYATQDARSLREKVEALMRDSDLPA